MPSLKAISSKQMCADASPQGEKEEKLISSLPCLRTIGKDRNKRLPAR